MVCLWCDGKTEHLQDFIMVDMILAPIQVKSIFSLSHTSLETDMWQRTCCTKIFLVIALVICYWLLEGDGLSSNTQHLFFNLQQAHLKRCNFYFEDKLSKFLFSITLFKIFTMAWRVFGVSILQTIGNHGYLLATKGQSHGGFWCGITYLFATNFALASNILKNSC